MLAQFTGLMELSKEIMFERMFYKLYDNILAELQIKKAGEFGKPFLPPEKYVSCHVDGLHFVGWTMFWRWTVNVEVMCNTKRVER